jgi:hypothetical protein
LKIKQIKRVFGIAVAFMIVFGIAMAFMVVV